MKLRYHNKVKKKSKRRKTVSNIINIRNHYHSQHYFCKTLNKQQGMFVKNILPQKITDCLSNKVDMINIFNFVYNRKVIADLCQSRKIKLTYSEVGFFPHYDSFCFDPLGFCWESSLTKMQFFTCSQRQCDVATRIIQKYRIEDNSLPEKIKHPFFLWPAQTISDQVNAHGLRCKTWTKLIVHFRSCLPSEIQLVIKIHPRSQWIRHKHLYALQKRLNNTVVVNQVSLNALLYNCVGVVGANSTVLYKGRLIYDKPTYVYAKSWFTGHDSLFFPISTEQKSAEIQKFKIQKEYEEYVKWFLYQLIVRQILRSDCKKERMIQKMSLLSSYNYYKYGEEIFV